MGKRKKWQYIMDLEVQDLKGKMTFSSKDLVWAEINTKNNGIDRVVVIPLRRVAEFIKGEEENPIAPCKFVRKTKGKPKERSTAALQYDIYHCSFGPEDKRGNISAKRRTSFVQKRGCQCHFIVKVMHEIPDRAILTFNIYEHEDGEGWACHGQGDTSGETRALLRPKLSRDIVGYVESCFFLGVPIDVVYRTHIKRHVDIDVVARDRDVFLCRKDIVNIYNRLAKGNYQLHKKDEMSVNLWYQKHREDFFFYQKPNGVEVPFIIGIQTKWMLETMVKLSHNSLIAMDSTFNTNKYGYQLYTLVAFDEQQSGVPVAWVVASRNTSDDISIWLEQFMRKCFQTRPDWKVNAFMVDDALAEISALRRITGCDVILCVWHVRRAWLKNVNRLATSSIKAKEMFSELGFIMKHTLNYEVEDAINQFFIKFADEEKFLDYFNKNWVTGDKIRK
eukprot:PITA_28427